MSSAARADGLRFERAADRGFGGHAVRQAGDQVVPGLVADARLAFAQGLRHVRERAGELAEFVARGRARAG